MAWRIPDWEQFEPPKRPDREQAGPLLYWKCPTSQNRRYKQLLKERGGCAKLGVWVALVSSWGRQTRESRISGILRSPEVGMKPASIDEISQDTMIHKRTLRVAIKRFIELGWLEEISDPGTTSDIPSDTPSVRQRYSETRLDETRQDKTLKNSEEPNRLSTTPPTESNKPEPEINQNSLVSTRQKPEPIQMISGNMKPRVQSDAFILVADSMICARLSKRTTEQKHADQTCIKQLANRVMLSAGNMNSSILASRYNSHLEKLERILDNPKNRNPVAVWINANKKR